MDCIRVTHPCAGRRQRYCYLPAAPRLACVRPVASVHPEPGSNSSLYFLYSLLYLRSVTWPNWLLSLLFPVLHLLLQFLQWTWQKFPGACPVSSFAVAKLMHFPFSLQIFFHFFMLYNITFLQQTVLHDFIIKHFFQKKSHYYLSELHLNASSADNLWRLSLYITTLLLRNYRFLGFFPILFPGTGEKIWRPR